MTRPTDAYRPATPAENLRAILALHSDLSPAEKRELEEAAVLLSEKATLLEDVRALYESIDALLARADKDTAAGQDAVTVPVNLAVEGLASAPAAPSAPAEAPTPEVMRERAEAAQSASGAWQPIETAPRDGSEILLVEYRQDAYGEIDVGVWGLIEKSDWDGSDVIGWLSNYGRIDEPTHWMPLPAAPMTSSSEREGKDG